MGVMSTNSRKLIFLLALSLSISSALGSTPGGNSMVLSYSKLTGSRFDTLTVAKVGKIEITAKEFLLSYEYGPAFVKRTKNSRRRHLEFMTYEKLLALDGYSHGVDTSQIVAETLGEIEGDLATEELYKEDVLSQVNVSDEEITRGVERENSHISLKWLYAPAFEEIDELQQKLLAGVSFDSLFAQQLRRSAELEDRFMETTRFKLETKNPTLSAIVDTLQFEKNSASIGTTDGWYIVRIVNLWTNAITTESEHNRLRTNVRRALFKRKADAASDHYVRQMMLEHDPVIKRQTFDILRAHLGKSLFPPEQFAEWEFTKKLMGEFGPIDSVKIDDHLHRTLVALADTDFKLRDFMSWYRTREPVLNFSSASPERFFVSLEQFVWRMVRDKLLVREARQREMHHRESVVTQRSWWRDKCVSALAKARMSQGIQLDAAEIRAYYEQNRAQYRGHNGQALPFEKIQDEVRRDAHTFEWNKRLLHRILQLKRKYPTVVNADVLNQLPIDIESQPQTIEVYAAKKGGTFPRPVFPTIDYQWSLLY